MGGKNSGIVKERGQSINKEKLFHLNFEATLLFIVEA